MKRILLTGFLLIVIFSVMYGQKVDSIRVEQAGDLIKVHYKIIGSTDYQTFRVNLSCSINGGLESVPRSISGDYGENVSGGRSDYMILWDVLKDVDEVKSVNFFVKAELVKDETPRGSKALKIQDPGKYWAERRFFILATTGFNASSNSYSLFGGRIAYMGKWGASIGLITGKKDHSAGSSKPTYNSSAFALDLSKRLLNNGSSQLHIMAGISVGDHESSATTDYQPAMMWGYDFGLMAGLKNLALYTGISSLKASFFSDLDSEGTTFIDFGLGIRF